jgi:hypothetical protein
MTLKVTKYNNNIFHFDGFFENFTNKSKLDMNIKKGKSSFNIVLKLKYCYK